MRYSWACGPVDLCRGYFQYEHFWPRSKHQIVVEMAPLNSRDLEARSWMRDSIRLVGMSNYKSEENNKEPTTNVSLNFSRALYC